MQFTEEQGFRGWRVNHDAIEGGLLLGKGYLVLAYGEGVVESTLSSLNNPRQGKNALRSGDVYDKVQTMLHLEPGLSFQVVDGNRYIDYRLGFGPVILGHGHPVVMDRVAEAIKSGTIFALSHELEVKVAEQIVKMCPGVDQVRFANSGTEATMHALRIARSHTGREKIIKFEGQYHGMYDYMLFSTASSPISVMGHRRSPVPVPTTSGIPRAIHDLVIALPFNDFETLERTVKQAWGDVAAIIVEPIIGPR